MQAYETSHLNTGCSVKLRTTEQTEEEMLVDEDDDGKTVFELEQVNKTTSLTRL
jgi:hypothetical protein